MGTRKMILVWYKGEWRIAQYGLWDGYPEGQGIRIDKFLNNAGTGRIHPVLADLIGHEEELEFYKSGCWSPTELTNIEALQAAFDNDMTFVATEKDVEEAWKVSQVIHKEASQLTVSDEFRKLTPSEKMAFCSKHQLLEAQSQAALFVNPSLSRDCGAYILEVVAHATEKVPLDIRLCMVTDTQIEWLYVIDLDENQFEIYCG